MKELKIVPSAFMKDKGIYIGEPGPGRGMVLRFWAYDRNAEDIAIQLIEADYRYGVWSQTRNEGRWLSEVPKPDGSYYPLRFNQTDVFIEPLLRIATDYGVESAPNPYWEAAEYEVGIPSQMNGSLGYSVEWEKFNDGFGPEQMSRYRLERSCGKMGEFPELPNPICYYWRRS